MQNMNREGKKMQNMKRCLILLLVSLLVISVTACATSDMTSTNSQATQTTKSTTTTTASQTTDPTADKVKFTFWANMVGEAVGVINSYDEVLSLQKWQEINNIEIEWLHPPTGQAKEQSLLMFSSNDLPDLIYSRPAWMPESEDQYIEEGVIVDIIPYLEQYAPNYNALLNLDGVNILGDVRTQGGRIARFTFIYGYMLPGEDQKVAFNEGIILRRDWLDKLKLEVPNTITELYNVLKTVKTGDPNENSEQDELPYITRGFFGSSGGLAPLSSAYRVKWTWGKSVHDGSIVYGPAQPEFKEFITEMQKWYSEGLIDPDFMATDNDIHQTKFLSGLAFATWSTPTAAGISVYNTAMAEVDPNFKLVAAPTLQSSDGNRYFHKELPTAGTAVGLYISAKCKNIERAVSAIDYAYSYEGSALLTVGLGIDNETDYYILDSNRNITGVTDTYKKDIEKSGYGVATVKLAVGNLNIWFDVQYPKFKYDLPALIDPSITYEAQETWSKDASWALALPALIQTIMTADETAEYNSIMTDALAYSEETLVNMVMGRTPVDKWDEYITTMNRIGIERATELYQAAYDRYIEQ